jgi:stage V sporulation protein G
MPSKKGNDGEYRDIAHPISAATRTEVQRLILEKYEEALKESENAKNSEDVDIDFAPDGNE